jgi:hypothetical protein
MPDDMLEDAITIAKQTLDQHDFETQGVEVRMNLNLRGKYPAPILRFYEWYVNK